jgi:phage gp29-like protein
MGKLYINEHDYIEVGAGSKASIKNLLKEIATRPDWHSISRLNMALPNPDPILKRQGKDISIYRDLTCDAHVFSNIESRKAGVLSMEWEIDRGKSKSRVARFIEDLFNDEAFDLYRVMEEILEAPLYGYQPLEIMWHLEPLEVLGKPQEWFLFDHENRLRYRPLRGPAAGELLPERKFLLPRHRASYDNPYGQPVLSRVFWPAAFKKGGLKFWTIFTEKFGMPFIVGKHRRNEDAKEIDKFADMLENMVQDAIAVIPDDGSVELLERKGTGGGDVYGGLLKVCNAEMSKAILGQTLTTEVGDRGSFAASKTHSGIRQDIVDTDRRLVEKTINQLIDWVVEVKFGDVLRPRFGLWEEEDVDKDLAERDKILKDTGVNFTKQYFQRAYGFEEDDFEISGSEDVPAAGEFAEDEKPAATTDQAVLDAAIDALDPKDLQGQVEQMLAPVMEMISGGASYNEVLEKIAGTYPDMEVTKLEQFLSHAIFVTETWAQINAEDET